MHNEPATTTATSPLMTPKTTAIWKAAPNDKQWMGDGDVRDEGTRTTPTTNNKWPPPQHPWPLEWVLMGWITCASSQWQGTTERGTMNNAQETGTQGTKTKMINDKWPHHHHHSILLWTTVHRVETGTGLEGDKGQRCRWQPVRGWHGAKQKRPKRRRCLLGCKWVFFLFSFHFLVTNNKNLR